MAVSLRVYKRETIDLDVEQRDERGKGPVGRLRREQEMLPGILYGHQQDPAVFKVGARRLERALAGGGQNAIFVLSGAGKGERAVVRDVQYHKVRGDVVHVDFLRINPEEEISASVPLTTVGSPVGVTVSGGALQHSVTHIDMTCVAAEMPSQVEIDITDLEIGDSIHVSDLLETESRITTDAGVTIVSVLQPRLTVEEEEEAAAEALAEAEGLPLEGEEGAEAPAEGAEGDEASAEGGDGE